MGGLTERVRSGFLVTVTVVDPVHPVVAVPDTVYVVGKTTGVAVTVVPLSDESVVAGDQV